jgi:hypothetical protein
MLTDRGCGRVGSALLVAVVTIAVIAALATAAIPMLAGYDEMTRADDARQILLSLQYSLTNATATLGRNGFVQNEGANKFAGKLSQLVVPIVAGDLKCNATTFSSGDATKWTDLAPYSGLYIVAGTGAGSGVRTPVAMIKDAVQRPSTRPQGGLTLPLVPAGRVALAMDSVSASDVANLDLLADNADGSGSGTIQWATSVAGGASYNYVIYTITTTDC